MPETPAGHPKTEFVQCAREVMRQVPLPLPECCLTCKFWTINRSYNDRKEMIDQGSYPGRLYCRRDPPDSQHGYRETAAKDWCGEYKLLDHVPIATVAEEVVSYEPVYE